MKRFFVWITIFVVILSMMTIPTFASENKEDVIDLGDGFYLTEVTLEYSFSRANDIVTGHTTGNIYHGTMLIGTATLWGIFDISGSTAKATDSSISGSGYNSGSYISGSSNCSRNTVSGVAYFRYNGIEKNVRLSISCSPDGTLS